VLGFASRAGEPTRVLGTKPSLRERLRAFGARRVGRARLRLAHGLRRCVDGVVRSALGGSRFALATSGDGLVGRERRSGRTTDTLPSDS